MLNRQHVLTIRVASLLCLLPLTSAAQQHSPLAGAKIGGVHLETFVLAQRTRRV